MFAKKSVDFITLLKPDNSVVFFEALKRQSEVYWNNTSINTGIYGFQIQEGTKWKTGLSDSQIKEFETILNIKFPESLRNFYKTMNGTTKPGINVYGNSGYPVSFSPMFYSFPDDIEIIKSHINWIYNATLVDMAQLGPENISNIFPVFSHRFMLLDIPSNPILSMYGDDIIYWADNLSKLLVNEIFENIYNSSDFESNPNVVENEIKFWLDFN